MNSKTIIYLSKEKENTHMGNANDAKIMELKEKIAEKKKAIKKASKRFQPITNCLIGIDGVTQNIQVCTADELTLLMIKLNSWKMSANDLFVEVPKIQGFDIDDWISDIEVRLDNINVVKQKKELEAAEKQLDKLLSEDKKTELAISEIEKLLQK